MHFVGKFFRGVAITAAFGLLGSVALAEGKSQGERKAAGEVYRVESGEPPSMDPTKQADSLSGFWLGHLMEGLTTKDSKGILVGGQAESFSVSSDSLTWTFHLRKGIKWHDGKAVVAADFVTAVRRLVDPNYASEYAFFAEVAKLKNAVKILKKEGGLTPADVGVKAINDSTLTITLEKPNAILPELLSFSVFYPVRQDWLDTHKDKVFTSKETFIGNGPFKLTRWVKDNSMRMEKATTYWNGQAIKLNAIDSPMYLRDNSASYNLYSTGGSDLVGFDKERLQLAQKAKYKISSFRDGSVFWLEPNVKAGKPLSNVNLRAAMYFGLNRQEYISKVEGIPGAKGALSFIPDYMPSDKPNSTFRKEYPLKVKDGDLAKAKEYINKYLAETKQSKVPNFTILGDAGSAGKQNLEYFQSTFSKLFGNQIKIEPVEFKTRLQKMRDGDFDVVIAGWGPDYFDVMTYADLKITSNENNRGSYSNPKVDELIEKARNEKDPATRLKYVAQAEQLVIFTDFALIPYIERARVYTVAPGLNGVRRAIIGADPDLRFAYWSK